MIIWCSATLDQWTTATLDDWDSADLCVMYFYEVEIAGTFNGIQIAGQSCPSVFASVYEGVEAVKVEPF